MKKIFASLSAAGLLLLTACGNSSTPVEGDVEYPDEEITGSVSAVDESKYQRAAQEAGVVEVPSFEDHAVVFDDDLYLMAYGSSSCPPNPSLESFDTQDDLITHMVLAGEDYSDVMCTMDMAPHAYIIEFSGAAVSSAVSVEFAHPLSESATEIPVYPMEQINGVVE